MNAMVLSGSKSTVMMKTIMTTKVRMIEHEANDTCFCKVKSPNREELNDQLDDLQSNLKDDFDFILSRFEKLQRSEFDQDCRDAIEIAKQLSNTLQKFISTISEKF